MLLKARSGTSVATRMGGIHAGPTKERPYRTVLVARASTPEQCSPRRSRSGMIRYVARAFSMYHSGDQEIRLPWCVSRPHVPGVGTTEIAWSRHRSAASVVAVVDVGDASPRGLHVTSPYYAMFRTAMVGSRPIGTIMRVSFKRIPE